ncbi:MAG: aldehyde dehydrogenase [Clostridiales bacterium]|nr:aldehyde dehydrogenase [Clostridiales bacterium]
MNNNDLTNLLDSQRKYFQSGATLPINFRVQMLKKLYATILKYKADIVDALYSDLRKSAYESYMSEIGMALTELSYMINHVRAFVKPKRAKSSLAQFPSKCYTMSSPYGNVLIMSPWNYPFLLNIGPLADAISAGNTAILKPSAYSPVTSALIKKMIDECFEPSYVAVVLGGREENSALLDLKFDFVFFTGSQSVGREVLRRSAEHLTPVVLELGGKSPCIVDSSASIKFCARRIVGGKLLNCGQTCIAPDYILCEKSIKDELVREIITQIKEQYGENSLDNTNYGKIISEKHFNRVCALIDKDKVVFGGRVDKEELRIEPTVLDNVSWKDAVMQEEIFGPVLPVLTFEKFDDVYEILKDKPKPLALYLFTQNKQRESYVMQKFQFGGGCVNDCIIHIATSEMGFGGVGESGMGSYHGKAGFDAFSHTKSIMKRKSKLELSMRYQPYDKKHEKYLQKFLK